MRIFIILLLAITPGVVPPEAHALEIQDGDKILLLGNTFIERAQKYGYLETAITAANPDKKLTFRNIGWSGDTVFGHARSYFGPPREGFGRLEKLVREEKPTLILANYGANASYRGESGLKDFLNGYRRLLDMVQKTGSRIAILTPLPQEKMPAPLPDPSAHNRDLGLYRDALVDLAKERGLPVIDLFRAMGEGRWPLARSPANLTDNGLHMTSYGYWAAAQTVVKALGQDIRPWTATIYPDRKTSITKRAKVSHLKTGKDQVIFTLTTENLTSPPDPRHTPKSISESKKRQRPVLALRDLPEGNWRLTHGNRLIARGTSEEWAAGIALKNSPSTIQAEELRKTINRKNELFFHKHRPQNETYLFGFRKHEQGKNSVEIPKFQPLIDAQEKTIENLRKPKPFTLIFVRE
ncbi:MAG: SGNH/GDSL hydrolase family protein [Opitutae bacterium]|nr:SGNH/GDSL hydrolase family protein [Opitutae bacterium]